MPDRCMHPAASMLRVATPPGYFEVKKKMYLTLLWLWVLLGMHRAWDASEIQAARSDDLRHRKRWGAAGTLLLFVNSSTGDWWFVGVTRCVLFYPLVRDKFLQP